MSACEVIAKFGSDSFTATRACLAHHPQILNPFLRLSDLEMRKDSDDLIEKL